MFLKCPQGNGVLCLQSLGPEPRRAVLLGSPGGRMEAGLVGCASLLSLHLAPEERPWPRLQERRLRPEGLGLFRVEVKLLGFLHMG